MNNMTVTQILAIALGWQGGTIHQVAEELHCKIEDILTAKDNQYQFCSLLRCAVIRYKHLGRE